MTPLTVALLMLVVLLVVVAVLLTCFRASDSGQQPPYRNPSEDVVN